MLLQGNPSPSIPSDFQRWGVRGPELLAVIAALVALALGLYQIDRRSFWLDEATTYYVSDLSWSRLLEIFAGAGQGWHPPTYLILLRLWRILGDGEVFLRSFSLLFAVLSVPALFVTARHLVSPWTAAVSALLLAGNGFFIYYAQEARTYALTMFLAIVSYGLLLRALEREDARRWIAWAAVATLGLYSHLYFGLIILAQALTLILPGLRPRSLKRPLVGFGAVAVLSLPMLAVSLSAATDGALSWVKAVEWSTLPNALRALAGGTDVAFVAYGLAVEVALYTMFRRKSWPTWGPLLLLWSFLPIAMLFAVSWVRPTFVVRYLIISLPAIVTLVAFGMTRLPSRLASVATVIVLAASATGVAAGYGSPYAGWREAAAYLAEHGMSGDAVVLWKITLLKPLAYQVTHLAARGNVPPLAVPSSSWDIHPYDGTTERTDAGLRFVACDYNRIWLVNGPSKVTRTTGGAIGRILAGAYEREELMTFGSLKFALYGRIGAACPS